MMMENGQPQTNLIHNKHLFCLTTSYPHYPNDISGVFVKRLNDFLLANGWQITVISFDRDLITAKLENNPSLTHQEKLHLVSVPVIKNSLDGGAPDVFSRSPLKSLLPMLVNMYRLSRRFHSEVQRWKKKQDMSSRSPLVICHWSIPSGWIARGFQPIVYCHGGDIALWEKLPFGASLARHCLSKAKAIICVSQDLKDRLSKFWFSASKRFICPPIHVLSMGVDKAEGTPQFKQELLTHAQQQVILCTLGRLVEIKGYDLLLEALGTLSLSLRKRVIWFMAGAGPEKQNLIDRAQQLDVRLVYLGQISPAQRESLFEISDLYVAPSKQLGHRVEGSPLSLREAALAGCTIMSTTLGGTKEILDCLPKEHVLIIQDCHLSIAQSLKKFLNNRDQNTCTLNSRKRVMDQAKQLWSWETLGPQHTLLIEQLCAKDTILKSMKS